MDKRNYSKIKQLNPSLNLKKKKESLGGEKTGTVNKGRNIYFPDRRIRILSVTRSEVIYKDHDISSGEYLSLSLTLPLLTSTPPPPRLGRMYVRPSAELLTRPSPPRALCTNSHACHLLLFRFGGKQDRGA